MLTSHLPDSSFSQSRDRKLIMPNHQRSSRPETGSHTDKLHDPGLDNPHKDHELHAHGHEALARDQQNQAVATRASLATLATWPGQPSRPLR